MTRRRIAGAIVAVALILGAIGAVWWWQHRAPEGFIVELRALDDGSAVVVWRMNSENDAAREWIAHFDGRGKLDWRHELPGLTTSRATFVIGDLVSVRYAHQKVTDQAVAAYALADGHLVWDRVLLASAKRDVVPFIQAFAAGGKLVEQVIDQADGIVHVLYVLDPGSGEILGHAPVHAGQEPFAPLALGSRLILHESGSDVDVVETRTGIAVRALRRGGGGFQMGCVIGDAYINSMRDDQGLALVAFDHGDPASRRVLAQPFHPMDGYLDVRSCGHYRDRMIFKIIEHASQPSRT